MAWFQQRWRLPANRRRPPPAGARVHCDFAAKILARALHPATSMQDGPRERLGRVGASALSDAELLALLFGTGHGKEGLGSFAARVLEETGGLGCLGRAGIGQLITIDGVGVGKAARIVAAIELGRRLAAAPLSRGRAITSSRDVVRALGPRYARAEREHFLAIPLDAKNRPVAELTIAVGGLSACPVAPADVFRLLLRHAASGVIFVHNHPSGEPGPSPDDLALTERLAAAGALLGIRVVDHVILGIRSTSAFSTRACCPLPRSRGPSRARYHRVIHQE